MLNAIDVNDLTKYYDGLLAVDHISFQVRQGEVFGFLGPNGAGKTTAIRMLAGLSQPTAGRAHVLGLDRAHDLPQIKKRTSGVAASGFADNGMCPSVDLRCRGAACSDGGRLVGLDIPVLDHSGGFHCCALWPGCEGAGPAGGVGLDRVATQPSISSGALCHSRLTDRVISCMIPPLDHSTPGYWEPKTKRLPQKPDLAVQSIRSRVVTHNPEVPGSNPGPAT